MVKPSSVVFETKSVPIWLYVNCPNVELPLKLFPITLSSKVPAPILVTSPIVLLLKKLEILLL